MKKFLEVLKDISALLVGAAAFLYVLGYTVHLAYFRLLGVEAIGQPLDYVRFAADYTASIIASLPGLLFNAAYYYPTLFQRPFPILTFCCFLIAILILVLLFAGTPLKQLGTSLATKKKLTLAALLNVMTIAGFVLLLQIEFQVAKVRDVLQTVDTADIQQMQTQLGNPEIRKWNDQKLLDLKKQNISRIYTKYVAAHSDTPGFNYWNEWFNPVANHDNSAKRSTAYLVLLLFNVILLLAGTAQLAWLRQFSKTRAELPLSKRYAPKLKEYWTPAFTLLLAFGLVIQIFLFPYIYATVGRYHIYPIVRLKLAQNHEVLTGTERGEQSPAVDDPNAANSVRDAWTHGVYLITQSDIEVVVYDRLNFFQIKHVPKTRILGMSQLFSASPFESCDTQEMTPCETLWIPEDTSTFDF